MRKIKIPKHGGPDGQGLPETSFTELENLLDNVEVTDEEAKAAIELCLGASKQEEWNSVYRPRLVERVK